MAQIPQTFSYQASARDKEGKVLANKTIIAEISILQNSGTGTIEYQEIHTPTTNEFGLFSLEIGSGQPTFTGTVLNFQDIQWANGNYFVKVRVDFGDASQTNGLADMGITKLQAVPYSFMSSKSLLADNLSSPVNLALSDLADISINNPQHNQTLIWNATENKWTAGESGSFLDSNGSTDLSGDWNISNNNISMQAGSFSLNEGSLNLTSGNLLLGSGSLTLTNGDLSLTSGSITVSGGSLTVENGRTTTDTLKLELGVQINNISNDGSLSGNSDFTIPTEKAIRTYVDNVGGGSNDGTGVWFTTASTVFLSDSRFIAVGTSSPEDKVHLLLENNEGFLISGENGGTVPNLGVGTRMAFYPAKAAFKSGRLLNSSSAWNDSNTGLASATFGQDNSTAGSYAFSSGINNSASGNASTALGAGSLASGISSFAVGNNAFALGKGSFSSGTSTQANTYTETALGIFNFSTGDNTDSWVATETLFSVGNGTAENARSNAFVIMKYGGTGVGLGQQVPIAMFQVGTAGNGTNALANSWDTFSDKRLKKDFSPIENPILKIEKIGGYYYYWKDGEDKSRQLGVIAQEVNEVIPEIVTQNTDGIYSVDYSKLTALLIESTKAQQAEIVKLKADNELLQKQLNEQNKRIESIEKYVKAAANVKINKGE